MAHENGLDRVTRQLAEVSREDVRRLRAGWQKYGDSWRKRGGGEAYHNLTRKWDRIERAVEGDALAGLAGVPGQDLFAAIAAHLGSDGYLEGKDGLLDDIGDLRRYLLLVEAYMLNDHDPVPRCFLSNDEANVLPVSKKRSKRKQ